MTGALDIGTARPLAAVTPVAQGAAIVQPLPEGARWNQWKAKGRADDAKFRRRLRMVIIDVGAVVAFSGAVWFALQF